MFSLLLTYVFFKVKLHGLVLIVPQICQPSTLKLIYMYELR